MSKTKDRRGRDAQTKLSAFPRAPAKSNTGTSSSQTSAKSTQSSHSSGKWDAPRQSSRTNGTDSGSIVGSAIKARQDFLNRKAAADAYIKAQKANQSSAGTSSQNTPTGGSGRRSGTKNSVSSGTGGSETSRSVSPGDFGSGTWSSDLPNPGSYEDFIQTYAGDLFTTDSKNVFVNGASFDDIVSLIDSNNMVIAATTDPNLWNRMRAFNGFLEEHLDELAVSGQLPPEDYASYLARYESKSEKEKTDAIARTHFLDEASSLYLSASDDPDYTVPGYVTGFENDPQGYALSRSAELSGQSAAVWPNLETIDTKTAAHIADVGNGYQTSLEKAEEKEADQWWEDIPDDEKPIWLSFGTILTDEDVDPNQNTENLNWDEFLASETNRRRRSAEEELRRRGYSDEELERGLDYVLRMNNRESYAADEAEALQAEAEFKADKERLWSIIESPDSTVGERLSAVGELALKETGAVLGKLGSAAYAGFGNLFVFADKGAALLTGRESDPYSGGYYAVNQANLYNDTVDNVVFSGGIWDTPLSNGETLGEAAGRLTTEAANYAVDSFLQNGDSGGPLFPEIEDMINGTKRSFEGLSDFLDDFFSQSEVSPTQVNELLAIPEHASEFSDWTGEILDGTISENAAQVYRYINGDDSLYALAPADYADLLYGDIGRQMGRGDKAQAYLKLTDQMGIPGFEDFDLRTASMADLGYLKSVVDDALEQDAAQAAQLFLPGNTIDTPQLPVPGSSGNNAAIHLKPFNDEIRLNLEQAGLNQEKIDTIVNTVKGQKPDPSSYLSQEYIDNHLGEFESSGVYKIMVSPPRGTIGGYSGRKIKAASERNYCSFVYFLMDMAV